MPEYGSILSRQGARIVTGSHGTFWVQVENHTLGRMPTFCLDSPDPGEVRRVIKQGRAGVASYLMKTSAEHPPNAWLYICEDPGYSLEKLAPSMRRNVRRALKELRVAPLTAEDVIQHGLPAFSDTRRRVGLADGTEDAFRKRFSVRAQCRAHVFVGAWKDNLLAAFLSITEVDDWAEIEGCFSRDALLEFRPNDILMYTVLSQYLVHEGRRLVSYGASSIQPGTSAEGLHAFKTKVGFSAQPVHRAFELHPLLRPFTNRLTFWTVNRLLALRPMNRSLRKTAGLLATLTDKQ